ncbi:MAG: NAD-binding protein [Chloroflexota bacterium]
MEDLGRQLRIAVFAFLIIIPTGTIGFWILEDWSLVDSFYTAVVTLSTVGYGDFSPTNDASKIFTALFVISGLSAFAFAGQAVIQFFTSPVLRGIRQRRLTQKEIDALQNHYIICGMGEMVDRTVEYLLQSAQVRRTRERERRYRPIDNVLDGIFGDDEDGHVLWLRNPLRKLIHGIIDLFSRQLTLLDVLVVVTKDAEYATRLRESGLLALVGDPTNDDTLVNAGIERAQAVMVMLDNDTESLLTVLTAHNVAPAVRITAAILDDDLSRKIVRSGASHVITPFDIAGQFLNNATFRPAVNAFFNGLMFEHTTDAVLTQLHIHESSPWLGKQIGALAIPEKFNGGVVGIRYASATYDYVPPNQHILEEDDILFVAAHANIIPHLKEACEGKHAHSASYALWQPLPHRQAVLRSEKTYSLVEAEEAIEQMSKHFIICADDRTARSAIARLDPTRPFVILSKDNTMTSELIKRGFRVVHGNPTNEETLIKAGIKRAQAIMVALEKKADSVLTVITSRSLNKRLLITTTANSDDMIEKLQRSGADRVVSPFHVAARFVLLASTQPELSGFVSAVLYNYQTGLETTEIYMEDSADWIGKTIRELRLGKRFNAGVVGIQQPDRVSFTYAPPLDYVIKAHEVLIIVTPMEHGDSLRDDAHGGNVIAPKTLRAKVLQSATFTPEDIQALMRHGRK